MSATTSPGAEVREQLLAAEERRQRALIAVDLDTLAELFDDSLVHIHAPGVVHTKAMLLEHTATRQAYLEITRGELNIRQFGDIAIMTGSITNRMRAPGGGERTLSGEVTQVLRRDESGAWRFVSFHMTPYGDAVWGKLPSEQQGQQGQQEQAAEQGGAR